VERIGFTPMEAILSATALGGEIMLRPDELGKVAPGYLADLILVDGNPLDDITILQDHDRLHMIMKDGHFHKETPDDKPAPAPDASELVDSSAETVVKQRP
jgi:imidazolonepropionase-like amidohydrolase